MKKNFTFWFLLLGFFPFVLYSANTPQILSEESLWKEIQTSEGWHQSNAIRRYLEQYDDESLKVIEVLFASNKEKDSIFSQWCITDDDGLVRAHFDFTKELTQKNKELLLKELIEVSCFNPEKYKRSHFNCPEDIANIVADEHVELPFQFSKKDVSLLQSKIELKTITLWAAFLIFKIRKNEFDFLKWVHSKHLSGQDLKSDLNQLNDDGRFRFIFKGVEFMRDAKRITDEDKMMLQEKISRMNLSHDYEGLETNNWGSYEVQELVEKMIENFNRVIQNLLIYKTYSLKK